MQQRITHPARSTVSEGLKVLHDLLYAAQISSGERQASAITSARICVSDLRAHPESLEPALRTENQQLLSESEQRQILESPKAISVLLAAIDVAHSEISSFVEPNEMPPWPPARYRELVALGRAIVAREPDIFDAEIHKTFGLVKTEPYPAPAWDCVLQRVLSEFESKQRGIPQAHIAADLVHELRTALSKLAPGA